MVSARDVVRCGFGVQLSYGIKCWMRKLKIFLPFLVVLSSACAVQPPVAELSFSPRQDALFEKYSDIPTVEEVHGLSQGQQVAFLSHFHDPVRAHIPAHERIYNYLDSFTEKFDYQANTYTAATAFALRRGDCMSLAVLTTALANIAGVRIEYQLVDADPVYDLAPDLAVRGVHVRSLLIDPEWQAPPDQFVFHKPGLLIDYFPSGKERFIENLDEGEYAARFYLNLAVEQLQQGSLDRGYWLTVKALDYDPESADALNTLAVIYRRKGSYTNAERVYQYAIDRVPNKLSLLRNYELMLTTLGRRHEAEVIRSKLRALNDPSPFSWYRGARDAFARGDLADAEFFYRKAVERAPYMPELRYGLAQVLAQKGEFQLAQAQIEQSLESVWGSSNRVPYKAKLRWLRQQVD